MRFPKLSLLICVLLGLGACAKAPVPPLSEDPMEAQNREVHLANRDLDRFIVRPTSNAYGVTVPAPVRKGVSNVASNLGLPGTVLNNLLQFNIEDAGANTFRFLMNTTFGFGGILDVATEAGLAERGSDFGETLYVWGAPEGDYIELPFVGPSTERHAVGRVIDTLIDPVNALFPSPERGYVTATGVAARFGDRYRLSDFVDSVLYESEDSYAQARLLYLQNRRFKLSGEDADGAAPDYFDPYEEVFGAE